MTGGAGQADLLEYDVAPRAVRRGQELVVFRRRARSYLARDPTVHPPAMMRAFTALRRGGCTPMTRR